MSLNNNTKTRTKTIVVGDLHGKDLWKQIIAQEEWGTIIFLGDYFDSWDLTAEEQLKNFADLVKFKREYPNNVVLLIGNHDHSYTSYARQSGITCSGFQAGAAPEIGRVLEEAKDLLQMAYCSSDYLFTHAGVGETWLSKNGYPLEDFQGRYIVEDIEVFVNDLWKYKPQKFAFTGTEEHGNSIGQTPIWIRPQALMKDSKEIKRYNIVQVVGHTTMNSIDIAGRATGGFYYFIDVLDSSKEYLILDGDVITTGNVQNNNAERS